MSGVALLTYEHIQFGADGVPIVAGTTIKVVELVMAQAAYGWSPEELHFQHPYLTLGQIHAALTYYWDHKDEMDADIARRDRLVSALQHGAEPSDLAQRLRRLSSQL